MHNVYYVQGPQFYKPDFRVSFGAPSIIISIASPLLIIYIFAE